MRCSVCNSEMQPLLTGMFCPNDCDRKEPAKPIDPLFVVPESKTIEDWAAALDEWVGSVWIDPDDDPDDATD